MSEHIAIIAAGLLIAAAAGTAAYLASAHEDYTRTHTTVIVSASESFHVRNASAHSAGALFWL